MLTLELQIVTEAVCTALLLQISSGHIYLFGSSSMTIFNLYIESPILTRWVLSISAVVEMIPEEALHIGI